MRPSLLAIAAVLIGGCGAPPPPPLQWEDTGGPFSQNIAVVVADLHGPATLTAALTNGELYTSSTMGHSWSRAATVLDGVTINRLVQDADSPDRMFALTSAGAKVSLNRGTSWQDLRIAEPGTAISALIIDPYDAAVLYAGTRGRGVWKSTDAGATWSASNASADARLASADVYSLMLDPAHPNTIFGAVSAMGIVRSSDAGQTWKSLTEELFNYGARATHIVMGKNQSMLLYGTNAGSIVRSTNGGESWIPSRNGLESDSVLSLASIRDVPDCVFAGTTTGLYMSTDFGSTWSGIPGLPAGVGGNVSIPQGPGQRTVVAYGQGIGVQLSTDAGLTWVSVGGKLGGATASALAADCDGSRVLVAVGSAILAQDAEEGSRWVPASSGLSGGLVTSVTPDPEKPATFYATTPNGLYVSVDAARTWQYLSRAIRGTPRAFALHPTLKSRALSSSDNGVFYSTDRGKTWSQPVARTPRWVARSFTFCPTNAGIIYAGTQSHGVIASQDGGLTWDVSKFGLPDAAIDVIGLDDRDPDLAYAYVRPGDCFRSTNRGLEWNRYAPPWKPADTALVAVDRLRPSRLVALVNDRELYYSLTGGGTWFLIADQYVGMHATVIAWDVARGMVYAGGKDKGVRRISVRSHIREEEE
jgi:photosystem II stability/assembly factor-like uncharacterized protein